MKIARLFHKLLALIFLDAWISLGSQLKVLVGARGLLPTQPFVAYLQKVAGSISTSLCSGSAFQSIAQQIEQAQDIMSDGSNQPGAACDAISIGMGFDATAVQLGSVTTLAPTPNPCGDGG